VSQREVITVGVPPNVSADINVDLVCYISWLLMFSENKNVTLGTFFT
jgi:hypothetical protein